MKSTLRWEPPICQTCDRKYPDPRTGICGVCVAERKRMEELESKRRQAREDWEKDPCSRKVEHHVVTGAE